MKDRWLVVGGECVGFIGRQFLAISALSRNLSFQIIIYVWDKFSSNTKVKLFR